MTLLEWFQAITATGAVGAFGVTCAVWLRTRPALKAISAQSETALRVDMMEQIGKLSAKIEAQDVLIAREREECHHHIARLEQQIQLFRHARNNADARFQALLILLKRSPDDVPGTIRLIEEMVAQQERALAAEKGAMAANLWGSPAEMKAEATVQAAQETLDEIKDEGK